MKTKSELMWCVRKFELIFVLCIFSVGVNGLDTNIATVAPLTADSPASSEKFIDSNSIKKQIETRLHDPQPEYYK